MKSVEFRPKETVVFFDPFVKRPRRTSGEPYCPYFQPAPLQKRPARHIIEPVQKIDPERE